MIRKWQIEHLWLDSEAGCKCQRFELVYTDIDKAIEDYMAYVNLGLGGWFQLVEITEKVISI